MPTATNSESSIRGKEKIMKYFLILVVLVGIVAFPLMAQDKVEIFGGYQYLHTGDIQSFNNSSQGFNGWDAAVTANFTKYLGVTGDFGGSYATVQGVSLHTYTYAGGPVIFANMGAIKPFAHVLLGGINLGGSQSGVSVSFNGFTTMVGGGVDARVADHFAVRLIDVDWVYYHFGDQTVAGLRVPSFSQSNNVRITTGLVIRF
jgi:hypothetical protein